MGYAGVHFCPVPLDLLSKLRDLESRGSRSVGGLAIDCAGEQPCPALFDLLSQWQTWDQAGC